MPISLLVYSFISLLGVASGLVLLSSDLGVITVSSPLILWFMFLVFSALGPLGIMMAANRPGRLLIMLGMAYTIMGLAAITASFLAAVGITPVLPTLELLILALLMLTGGLSLAAAGRTAISISKVMQ